MTDWIIAISTTLLMLATAFLAIAAWQAKKGFLQESLYNDSWELYKKWNDLRIWVFSNRAQLDSELSTKEKVYCDILREKLDSINFLCLRVKCLFKDKLEKMVTLLSDLDSVWLTYATKQSSKDIDKYKDKILQRLGNEDVSYELYNGIISKMR